jgi:N-acetylneuraminic acid mutarotase
MAPGLVFEYDPATDRWTRKKDMPVKVHHQAQTPLNGKLYVFGGCLQAISGEGGTTNAWEWDPVADSWRALAPLTVKRCSAVAEQVDGKIYLIGGLEPMENGKGTRCRAAIKCTTRPPTRGPNGARCPRRATMRWQAR